MRKKNIDVYEVAQILIQSAAQVLGLPSFAVSIAIMQLRNMPEDKLKQILKQIFKTLKQYEGELEDE